MSADRYHIQRRVESDAEVAAAFREALRRHVPVEARPDWSARVFLVAVVAFVVYLAWTWLT